jgi:hypothetical protein
MLSKKNRVEEFVEEWKRNQFRYTPFFFFALIEKHRSLVYWLLVFLPFFLFSFLSLLCINSSFAKRASSI